MPPFPFQTLLAWYQTNGRHDLPWRDYNFDKKTLGYRVWLAEIILQQTQASRGAIYFEKIIKKFPNIESLANTNYETFFEYYDGLGYYSRARNMLATAKQVVEKYDGIFPQDYDLLIKLPGVGPYTAKAILAFAYETPVLSFDTNLEKVFSRYFFGDKYRRLTPQEKEQIEKQFQKTGLNARNVNNALMDFSAILSSKTLENIDQENYPLKDCLWFKTQGTLEIIPPKNVGVPLVGTHIIIHLHENHQTYFSLNEEEYKPFEILGTKSGSRETVKSYFQKNFGISVSVRPPHKVYEKNGNQYVECNAQIQKGKHEFFEFKKEEVRP